MRIRPLLLFAVATLMGAGLSIGLATWDIPSPAIAIHSEATTTAAASADQNVGTAKLATTGRDIPSNASKGNSAMLEHFKLKATMRNLSGSRQATPILYVIGDARATQQNVADAAKRAQAGDNDAAIALSRLTANHLITLKAPRPSEDQLRAEMIPDGVTDDTLFWLRLAADRSDSLAKLLYVNTVMTSARLGLGVHHTLDSARLSAENKVGLKYLDSLVADGVADSLKILAAAYSEGLLGLEYDAPKAHAALMTLQTSMSTPETKALVDKSASKLRAGELERANQLLASGQWRILS